MTQYNSIVVFDVLLGFFKSKNTKKVKCRFADVDADAIFI